LLTFQAKTPWGHTRKGRPKADIEQKLGSRVPPSLVQAIVKDCYGLMVEFFINDFAGIYDLRAAGIRFTSTKPRLVNFIMRIGLHARVQDQALKSWQPFKQNRTGLYLRIRAVWNDRLWGAKRTSARTPGRPRARSGRVFAEVRLIAAASRLSTTTAAIRPAFLPAPRPLQRTRPSSAVQIHLILRLVNAHGPGDGVPFHHLSIT
jgi:hypothetical protein